MPEVRVSALGTDAVVDGCLASGAELAWAQLTGPAGSPAPAGSPGAARADGPGADGGAEPPGSGPDGPCPDGPRPGVAWDMAADGPEAR
jgi:hypothetical protein